MSPSLRPFNPLTDKLERILKPWAYYNEWDEYAAHRLRQNIAQGLIMPGFVDNRSIKEVMPDDLEGFTQCHFFAGLGLWSYSARRAGWPDARPLWTGSCPCQPFSAAGKQGGTDDPRHLWPDLFRLTRAGRPPELMGEQVAGSAGYGWFDGVRSDLESEGYAGRAVDFPACSIDAPHIRNRLYWIAQRMAQPNGSQRDGRTVEPQRREEGRTAVGRLDARSGGVGLADTEGGRGGTGLREVRPEQDGALTANGDVCCGASDLDNPESIGRGEGLSAAELRRWWATIAGADALERHIGLADTAGIGRQIQASGEQSAVDWSVGHPDTHRNGSFWSDAEWIKCHDGKARRTQPGLRLLVDGYSNRISDWRTTGNAISPEVAIQVIAAYLETEAASAA